NNNRSTAIHRKPTFRAFHSLRKDRHLPCLRDYVPGVMGPDWLQAPGKRRNRQLEATNWTVSRTNQELKLGEAWPTGVCGRKLLHLFLQCSTPRCVPGNEHFSTNSISN